MRRDLSSFSPTVLLAFVAALALLQLAMRSFALSSSSAVTAHLDSAIHAPLLHATRDVEEESGRLARARRSLEAAAAASEARLQECEQLRSLDAQQASELRAQESSVVSRGGCVSHADGRVTCEREAPSLVIVLPFPPKQLHFVRDNLDAWQTDEFFPCDVARGHSRHFSLVFFLSQRDEPTQRALRDEYFNSTWAKECFSSIVR